MATVIANVAISFLLRFDDDNYVMRLARHIWQVLRANNRSAVHASSRGICVIKGRVLYEVNGSDARKAFWGRRRNELANGLLEILRYHRM